MAGRFARYKTDGFDRRKDFVRFEEAGFVVPAGYFLGKEHQGGHWDELGRLRNDKMSKMTVDKQGFPFQGY